ncbi:MAG: pitrilysin family protein [Gemmatimonadota bacterium]
MSSARATPPVLPEPALPRLPAVQRFRLVNGVEVLLVERHELPVVDAQIVVRSGAFHDDAARAGRAFLTADLLDQGTTSRSATQIADEVELLGASLHTRGSWDFSAVALHVLTPRLAPAVELLADVLLNPTFPEVELERRRDERLAAILQEQAEPRSLASLAFADVIYGAGHPFGRPLNGDRDTVTRITRTDLLQFYGQRFTPDNAFIVLVGDVAPALALPLLERLVGGWSGRRAPQPHAHEALPRGGVGIHIVDRPGAQQSELRLGLPGPPRATPDYFPLLVANTVLGGAFTSRLNMVLREEKAYTYGAGSNIAFRTGGGPFLASTAVASGATADAVATVVREVRRMGAERVPDAELEGAKNYIVLGLPRTFETTADIAEHVSDAALHDLGADYHDRFAERVRAVTSAEVVTVAARWLRADELAVVIAGDAAAIRSDLESLRIGDVHVREAG